MYSVDVQSGFRVFNKLKRSKEKEQTVHLAEQSGEHVLKCDSREDSKTYQL